jgi:excisionase family DNA binding protein
MTTVPTLADLAGNPDRVDELAPEQARALLAQLATLQAPLLARALANGDEVVDKAGATRLLTVPEAAERLAIPASFLYELIRQGRVPAQRIGPKYVRLHPATVAEIQQRGLDGVLSVSYSPEHDGIGARRAPQSPEADAGRVRGAARRPRQYAGSVRTGRDRDPGAGRAPGPTAGVSA